MNIRTKLNHFQNQALYSHQFNMMHCESESCYSGHCNVKSGDYDLDYDGIYNYPEYDDYAMDYNYTCGAPQSTESPASLDRPIGAIFECLIGSKRPVYTLQLQYSVKVATSS